jgi:hypothetical protein
VPNYFMWRKAGSPGADTRMAGGAETAPNHAPGAAAADCSPVAGGETLNKKRVQ